MKTLSTLKPPPWLLREISMAAWSVRTVFAHVFGRWHVFRDVPDWALIRLASIETYGDDDPIEGYVREANEELRLRLLRLKRECEAMEREALHGRATPNE